MWRSLASASVLGTEGRGFKSLHRDQTYLEVRFMTSHTEELLLQEWVEQGNSPAGFPRLNEVDEDDLEWATILYYQNIRNQIMDCE